MSLNPTTQYLLAHECPSIGNEVLAFPPRPGWPTARRASGRRGSLAAVPLAGGVASLAFSLRSLWGVQ
jgi:hypothetical protein